MDKLPKYIAFLLFCYLMVSFTIYSNHQSHNLTTASTDVQDGDMQHIQSAFKDWMQQTGNTDIQGSPIQYFYRLQIFKLNYITVKTHNSKASQGQSSYYLTLNRFAHMTHTQYKFLYNNLNRQTQPLTITNKCNGSIADAPNPPPSVNWTAKNIVSTTVINEEACAANWAIASIAALEALAALKLQNLVKYSEQQLIDCSQSYGNQGCGGGFMQQAYWYMIDNGIATQKSYPLVNKQQKCKYVPSMKSVSIKSCASVPSQSYNKLISAVIQQPVTVAVESDKFMLYDRGIYTGDCGTSVDRGMLLTGYGVEGDHAFWLVKNSLGPNWGEKGYIRLERKEKDGPGMCGIQLAASIPLNIA